MGSIRRIIIAHFCLCTRVTGRTVLVGPISAADRDRAPGSRPERRRRGPSPRLRLIFAALLLTCRAATAQTLPSGPYQVLDGRVVLGGELVATFGDTDDVAFFNFTDYEHNALRMFRLGVSGLWRPARWLEVVGDVRSEDFDRLEALASYVRVRPWASHRFDIQAGIIPPTFGGFSRRAYGPDNPLIGYPLAYQYLTSLRPDAVPASAADLLRMRGWGWRSSFPIGSKAVRPGVPLVTAFRWDTGVQVRWGYRRLELAGSVTTGTLSNPRISDDNGGRQLSGRASVTPVTGLVIGGSWASGAWLSSTVPGTAARHLPQTAVGTDAEYSRGHWLVRGEAIFSRWALPFPLVPSPTNTVGARSLSAEGRYRLTPRIFVAGRIDRLDFSHILNPTTLVPTNWEADVVRGEAAVGYYFQRNLIGRVSVQPNHREAGKVLGRTYLSAQLSYLF
jgi:hypothetical protein